MSDSGEAPAPESRTQTVRAVVLVVVVVVIAVGVLRHTATAPARAAAARRTAPPTTSVRARPSPQAAVTTTSTTTTTVPLIVPAHVTVAVLNGLQSGPLASNLTKRLDTAGYQTLIPDNTTAPTRTSVIYVARSGYYREAVQLAAILHLPAADVRRAIPAGAPIPTGRIAESDLIVVIGTSLAATASSA